MMHDVIDTSSIFPHHDSLTTMGPKLYSAFVDKRGYLMTYDYQNLAYTSSLHFSAIGPKQQNVLLCSENSAVNTLPLNCDRTTATALWP